MEILEGRPLGAGRRIVVVVSRFNEQVTERLLEGALGALRNAGVPDESVLVVRVPGAFELPLAAQKALDGGQFQGVVALGAVIRGETTHYDCVCAAAQQGLLEVGLRSGVPIGFGVLTCDTDAQAEARSGGEHGNKGADTALAVLEMVDVAERLAKRRSR